MVENILIEYEEEIWKDIPNSKEYMISNFGKVKRKNYRYWNKHNNDYSIRKEKILSPNANNTKGYFRIPIYYNNGNKVTEAIHRLVALCFIPNPNNLPQVNHIDGNKLNNYYKNLEWCTNQENMNHRFGVLKNFSYKEGESCNFTKLTEEQVKQIPELLNKGWTKTAIAQEFKVAMTTICEITAGRSWSHLGLFEPKDKKQLKYSKKDRFKICSEPQ